MTVNEKKFSLYLIALRFLGFKITPNIERIYLNIDMNSNNIMLIAFYHNSPSELEMELLDDIVTNTNAHIPDFFVEASVKLMVDFDNTIKYDFNVFAMYAEY